MTTLYGIANCDTMKKARTWLKDQGVEYEFHDYKKLGVPEKELKKWCKALGWETLLNKRGTTWRKLDDAVKEKVTTQTAAIKIMLDNPSIIKRPVLDVDGEYRVGFSAEDYAKAFK